jgi:hypothetical protein
VSVAQDVIEFIVWNPDHQVVPNDAAAHPAADEEREATEHPALSDALPGAERASNAIRKLLVVCHDNLGCA